jgi:hypothetical protein
VHTPGRAADTAGLLQRALGMGQQVVGAQARLRVSRHSDRDHQPAGGQQATDRRLALVDQTTRQRFGRSLATLAQQHAETGAAEPGQAVLHRHMGAQAFDQRCHRACLRIAIQREQPVAVELDAQHGQRHAVAPRGTDRVVDLLHEAIAFRPAAELVAAHALAARGAPRACGFSSRKE